MNSDTALDSNQKLMSNEIPEDSKTFDVKDDERISQDDNKSGSGISGPDGNERIPCEAKPTIDTNSTEVEGTNHKTSEHDGLLPQISSLQGEGIQCTSVTFTETKGKKDGDKSSSSSSQQSKPEDHPTVDVDDAKDVRQEISLSGRDQIGSTKVAENPDEAIERETSVGHVKSMFSISSNESDNSMTSDDEEDEDEDDEEEDDENEEEEEVEEEDDDDDGDDDEDSSSTLERNSVTSSNARRTCNATANNCPEVCHHASGCHGDDDRKEYAGKHDADENKKDRIHETSEERADESDVFPGRNRMTDSDKSIPDEDESGNRGYRVRSMIAGTQQLILKAYYKENPRPTGQELEQLAARVCFPKRVVQVWFQNMRARDRRKNGKTPDGITSPSSPQIHSSISSAGGFGGMEYPVDSNPSTTGMFYSSPYNVSLSSPSVQIAQAPMISGIPGTVNELHGSLLLNTPPYSLHQLLRQQLQTNINAAYLAEKLRGRVGFPNVDDSQRYAEQLSQSSQPTCFDMSSGCSKKERKVIHETNSTAPMQSKLSSGYLTHYQGDHGDSVYESNWMFRSSGFGFHGHSFYAFTNEEPLDLSKHSLAETSCEAEKIKPDPIESNEILDLRMSKSSSTQSPSISQSVVDEESCEMDEKPSDSLAGKESLATVSSPSKVRTTELTEDKQLVGSSNDKPSHQVHSQSHAIYPETGKDFGQNCPFGLNGTPLEQYFSTTAPHYHHLAGYSSYPLMLNAAMKSNQLPRSIHLANISANKDWDFASLALDKMQQIRIRDLIEHTKNSTTSEDSLRIRKTSKKVAFACLWNRLKIF